MDIQQINSAIIQGKFTMDELTSIQDAVKYNRSLIARDNMRSIRAGAVVRFTGRHGQVLQGSVTKVAIKYISVHVDGVTWRVPASMLTAV